MGSTIDKIKEWLLCLLCHNDNLEVPEQETNTQENITPIGDDNPISIFKEVEESEVKKNAEETNPKESSDILLTGSDAENGNNLVFDEIEPLTPLEVAPQKVSVIDKPKKEEQALGKLVDESKLVSLTIDSIKYYDKLRCQMQTEDLRNILDDVCRNLIDNLILAGCTPINEEPGSFDMSRHRIEPFQMVEDGTPYSRVIRKGVEFQKEVKLLAIVEL